MLRAIITADIVNSRRSEPNDWLKTLRKELNQIGKEPKSWEIYRGDSFQFIHTPRHALRAAVRLKTAMMQHKGLDVRLGIGIGEISYDAEKITESNGSAFVHSGKTFDQMGKEVIISIKTPWTDFDETMNLMLQLLGKIMSGWNQNQALIVRNYLDNPSMTQRELGEALNKKQSNISSSLTKAGYDELIRVLDYYESLIASKMNPRISN